MKSKEITVTVNGVAYTEEVETRLLPVQFARQPHLQTTGIRFATLMRELTHRNGGTFVGLNDFR